MNIDSKKLFIINYLYNKNDWSTSNDISIASSMSVRSVKTYVSEINKEFNCIYSSKKGYMIDKNSAKTILSEANSTSPMTYEEKKSYIITQVVINKNHPTLDELCDYFYVSPSTLDNFIAKLRVDLKKENLVVNVKNNVLYINGSIDAISHVAMSAIHNEVNEFYFSLSKLQAIFPDIDLVEIKHVVTSILNEYNYFLDDFTLLNYILHLALAIELNRNRPEEGNIDSVELTYVNQQPHILEIVKRIYLKLKDTYHTSYSFTDIHQASILMMTRIVTSNVDDLTFSEVEKVVGSNIFNLLNAIIVGVKTNYAIDLSNERFLVRFAFHLKNLHSRLCENISIANLQFSSIKNEYPLLYDIACYVASIIKDYFGYSLPEDEISYISLHIGLLVEENNAIENKVNTIVICPSHINYSFSKEFMIRLTTIFSDSLLITEVNSLIDEEINLDNVDLIISTEKINLPIKVRQVVVGATLSEKNIKQIFDVVDDIKELKKKNRIKESFVKMFNPDLFFVNRNYQNENDAINDMCDRMYELGYVDEDYKNKVFAREQIAPCSYTNIAIPHPLNSFSTRSSIGVAINKTPFTWADNKVSLVLMLSLDSASSDKLANIFDFFFTKLDNDAIFQRLISCSSYNEFISVLFE